MRPRWLAWAAFLLRVFAPDFADLRSSRSWQANHIGRGLIIRFLFSYTGGSTYAAENFQFGPGFPEKIPGIHKMSRTSIAAALRS